MKAGVNCYFELRTQIISLGSQSLDLLDFFWLQMKIKDIQVLSQMVGVGSTRQRNHADLDREPENQLWDGSTVACRDPRNFPRRQYFAVGGQQREPLVDDSVGFTEFPNLTIPTQLGEASVLHKARLNPRAIAQYSELIESNIADTKQPSPTAIAYGFHRPPRGPIVRSQSHRIYRTVQQICWKSRRRFARATGRTNRQRNPANKKK